MQCGEAATAASGLDGRHSCPAGCKHRGGAACCPATQEVCHTGPVDPGRISFPFRLLGWIPRAPPLLRWNIACLGQSRKSLGMIAVAKKKLPSFDMTTAGFLRCTGFSLVFPCLRAGLYSQYNLHVQLPISLSSFLADKFDASFPVPDRTCFRQEHICMEKCSNEIIKQSPKIIGRLTNNPCSLSAHSSAVNMGNVQQQLLVQHAILKQACWAACKAALAAHHDLCWTQLILFITKCIRQHRYSRACARA